MKVEWRPVGNFWPGRAGERVAAICLHVAEGGRAGVYQWFSNPESDVSAHYLVNKDGSVWQFVATDDTAWANGIAREPDLSIGWLAACLKRGQNPNRLTVAVETERYWHEPLTEPQYRALVALLRELLARYGLRPGRETIVPHAAIDSVSRARCPGNVDWARLLSELATGADELFPVTGRRVRDPFLTFWRERGGLPLFGYPLTEQAEEGGLLVQYFERARFELHPDAPEAERVQLGRVGAELLAARG